ncbi:magnesium transporter [Gimesia chilikensis]|jgi:magnesium transporter|uniref:magnesium transporter n=1 Tax=Gimesia chilikensis TaxID=2605989 RepID=UPI000C611141|nr:magnesium transporter [Gimesia chilikensis]MBN74010.1 magnesium transporter [Gimesia sp.]QDT83219.1 Magnesium transporter MgtE [Gimesia chilikensis]
MYGRLLLPELQVMLDENDNAGIREFCEALYPAVTAEILAELDSREVWRVISCCDSQKQAEIFQFLSLPQQIEIVAVIDRGPLSKLIEEMAPDDRVDLLSRMDEEHVEELLPLIAQAERSDIRKLLSYPEDSAGAIMTTEYAYLPANITVAQALEKLRQQAPDSEIISYIYVVDEGRRLQGIVSLRELIFARPTRPLSELINRDVISVRVDDDQEFVAQQMAKFDFVAIPVVDNQNQLVGIVTHDDAIDIMQEEATEDAYRLAAVEPLEDSYLSTSLVTVIRKRIGWLIFLLVPSFLAAKVLEHYEAVSDKFEWLVLFIPLILASGGNAGSQSATLIIRAMALETNIQREELNALLMKEFKLGLLLGSMLSLISFGISWAFTGALMQATVVGLAVFLVVLMGISAGGMLPMGFRKLGMDPALMSNPFITALVDILGLIIYFQVAMYIVS